MKADAHRRHAESLERAIALAKPDPATSVAIIENAWGAAYHWISYGCIQRYQQHRDKHQGLTAYIAAIPAWLDPATSALVEETVTMLSKRHSEILLAVILFGSVARHEERPLEDSSPSDVDLLVLFDTTDRLVKPYREEIFATIIDACALHLDAPREVNVLLSDRTMHTWNAMFLDNLARDGMFLYARGSLPASLATRQPLQERLPTS